MNQRHEHQVHRPILHSAVHADVKMGLSSFWHSLTGHKAKEVAPPKHHNKPDGQRQRDNENSTHPALRQNNAPWETQGQSAEQTSKRAKRRSAWRPSQPSATGEPILATSDKKAKRRSFWRSEPQRPEFRMYTISTPGVPAVPVGPLSTQRDLEQKMKKRQSVVSMASVKSSKSTKSNKSHSKRLSIFGGRVDDDDSDEDIPDVPALPTTVPSAPPKSLPYQCRRDVSNNTGMRPSDENVDERGTAVASDKAHTTARPSLGKQNRLSKQLSLQQSLDRRKSMPSDNPSKSGKSRRPSWFSSSNPDDGEAVPPVPALGFDNMPSPNTNSTFNSDFERFLLTAHKNAPGPNKVVPTDFERYLQESAEYDAAKSTQLAHHDTDFAELRPMSTISSANRRGSYAGPRNAARSFRMSTTQAPAAVRHTWRQAEHSRNTMPARAGGSGITMSADEQKEWEKWKELMDIAENKEEDGVMGLPRQFDEDEDEEARAREENRGRKRNSRTVHENGDALAALELGVTR